VIGIVDPDRFIAVSQYRNLGDPPPAVMAPELSPHARGRCGRLPEGKPASVCAPDLLFREDVSGPSDEASR
jgi:hypothetical protein